MITDLFLQIANWLIRGLIWLLPDWSTPSEVINSISWLFTHLAGINLVFPIYALVTCIGILTAFFFTTAVVRVIAGIFSIIRGGGNLDV